MKRLFFILISVILIGGCDILESLLPGQEPEKPEEGTEEILDPNFVSFPDANFRAYMMANFDTDKDGRISKSEAAKVENIECTELDIISLEGIEFCTGLISLDCYSNKIESLDVSMLKSLKTLYCNSNELTVLDLSGNPRLERVSFSDNPWKELNFGSLQMSVFSTDDRYADFSGEFERSSELKIKGIFLSNMHIGNNPLKSLDVSGCPSLTYIECNFTPLEYLNLGDTDVPELHLGDIYEAAESSSLTIVGSKVRKINIMSMENLRDLDVNQCPALTNLFCEGCFSLSSVNFSQCRELEELYLSSHQIEVLDISENTKLKELRCYGEKMRKYVFGDNKTLELLSIDGGQIEKLDASNLTALKTLICIYCNMVSLDVSGCSALEYISWGGNKFEYINLGKANPKEYDDGWSNGEIISKSYPGLDGNTGRSLEFISEYTTKLDVSYNPELETLDVSGCPSLDTLLCNFDNYALTTLYLKTGQEISELYKNNSTEIIYK